MDLYFYFKDEKGDLKVYNHEQFFYPYAKPYGLGVFKELLNKKKTADLTFYCKRCGKKVTEEFNLKSIENFNETCNHCKTLNIEEENSDIVESRVYKITGNKERLDTLEVLFDWLNAMSSFGSFRECILNFDGDSGIGFKITLCDPHKDLSTESKGFSRIQVDERNNIDIDIL